MKNIFSYTAIIGIVGFILLSLLLAFSPGFAKSGEAMCIVSCFIGLFAAFDKFVMKDIDTIDELKKGNISYALFLVSIALLFVAAAIIIG